MAIDKKQVLNKVQRSLEVQFEDVYSWEDMIDDTELTDEEKAWAKKNIGYKAYVCTKEKAHATKTEFKFGEKQGRLVFEVSAYLEMDLDNEDLQRVFDEIEIEVKHKLISDYEINPIVK